MESFFDKKIFEKIKEFVQGASKILLLAHLDADGLSSAGIIGKLLMSCGKTFTVKVLKQLEDDKVFQELSDDLIIIADMGSGQLNIVKDYVGRKKFIIIDHHQIQDNFEHENLIHFNPGIYDDSYSASGLCYLIAKELNPSFEKLVHLGLVGAVGDAQYQENFKGFNQEMLEFGLEKNYLGRSRGLNLFGRVSKPLHETLANSFELTIPGVSGNESGAIELLSELNIDLKNEDGRWKTLAGLNDAERKKLITNILIRRANKGLNDDVLRNIISINGKKGLLIDLNEWSVLLNACGRQGIPSLGVLLCMGFENYTLPLIDKVIKEYKILLANSLNIVNNDDSIKKIINGVMIINAGSKIKDTIIGTVGSMIIRGFDSNIHTFIGFADRNEDEVKVSARTKKKINIGEIIKNICSEMNSTGGGHKSAGGALIKKGKEDEFIKLFQEKTVETLIK